VNNHRFRHPFSSRSTDNSMSYSVKYAIELIESVFY